MSQPELMDGLRRILSAVRADLALLRLEMRVVTGGRLLLLLGLALLWFVAWWTWAQFADEPANTTVYYTRMLVLPGFVIALIQSMGAVVGERDSRQLEVTFVTPAGRFKVWVYRFLATVLAAMSVSSLLSLLTFLLLDREHPWASAILHALVPVLATVGMTVFFSVLFKSGAPAGLVTCIVVAVLFVLQDLSTISFWFNPYEPPRRVEDAEVWFRAVVHNRAFFLSVAAMGFVGGFSILQRRERLL